MTKAKTNKDTHKTPRPFTIGRVMTLAWYGIQGIKGALLLPFLCFFLVNFGLLYAINHFDPVMMKQYWVRLWATPFASVILTSTFYIGAIMAAVQRLRGVRVNADTPFRYFRHYCRITGYSLVLYVIFNLANIIIELPVLHASLAGDTAKLIGATWTVATAILLCLTVPLALDKDPATSWRQIMAASIRHTHRHIGRLILMCLILYFFFFLSTSLLQAILIAHHLIDTLLILAFVFVLIWVIPYTLMLQASTYVSIVLQNSKDARNAT